MISLHNYQKIKIPDSICIFSGGCVGSASSASALGKKLAPHRIGIIVSFTDVTAAVLFPEVRTGKTEHEITSVFFFHRNLSYAEPVLSSLKYKYTYFM